MSPVKIKKIRGKITRAIFATLIGTSEITIWRWETSAAKPEGAALRLLELMTQYREETLGHLMELTQTDFRKSI